MALTRVAEKRMGVPEIRMKARALGLTPGKAKKAELIHAIQMGSTGNKDEGPGPRADTRESEKSRTHTRHPDGRGSQPMFRQVKRRLPLHGLLLHAGLPQAPVLNLFATWATLPICAWPNFFLNYRILLTVTGFFDTINLVSRSTPLSLGVCP
jgi:hypothetical protein